MDDAGLMWCWRMGNTAYIDEPSYWWALDGNENHRRRE